MCIPAVSAALSHVLRGFLADLGLGFSGNFTGQILNLGPPVLNDTAAGSPCGAPLMAALLGGDHADYVSFLIFI